MCLFSSGFTGFVSVHRDTAIPFLTQQLSSVGYCSKTKTSTLQKTLLAPLIPFFHSASAEEIDVRQLTQISPNSPQIHIEHLTMPTFLFPSPRLHWRGPSVHSEQHNEE